MLKGRVSRQGQAVLGLMAFVVGCTAPAKERYVQLVATDFPPRSQTAIKVLLAPPLEGIQLPRQLQLLFQGVPQASKAPEEYVQCVWEDGQNYVVNAIGINIEFWSTAASVPAGLPHPKHWISWEKGQFPWGRFILEDREVLDALKEDGYDFVVIPRTLAFRPAEGVTAARLDALEAVADRTEGIGLIDMFELGDATAIVDTKSREIVWDGTIAVGGSKGVYSFVSEFRQLNVFEVLSYSWTSDLLVVLNRMVTPVRHLYELPEVCG